MEYGKIRGIGKPVSRLIFGTTSLDAGRQAYSDELLDAVYAQGINTFDTALVYGNGSEIALGAWIAKRGLREKVNIITKGCHPDGERKRVSREEILADCAESLERLGVEKIDGYLLHRDDPEVPVEEIGEALNELKARGKIDAFGGSNWTWERVEEINAWAEKKGMTGFTMTSPQYSLAVQVEDPWGGNALSVAGPGRTETAARAYYRQADIPILAYSSLGRGFLSGKFTSDHPEDAEKAVDIYGMKGFAYPVNFERLKRAEEMARKYGKTVPQIALAWLLKQKEDVFPILSVSRGERMKSNVEAMDIDLTAEEARWMNLED